MPTDTERREAARKLRELEGCSFDDGEYIDRGEVEGVLDLWCDDGAWYEEEGVMRLADLIEPNSKNSDIDRNALTTLARNLDLLALMVNSHELTDTGQIAGTCQNIANGIREALEVDDG